MGYLLAEDEESLFVQPQWSLSLSALGTDIPACANSSAAPAKQAVLGSPLTQLSWARLSFLSQTSLLRGLAWSIL